MSNRIYGENINYCFRRLKSSDKEKLNRFSCGNKQLDNFIQNKLIIDTVITDEDGVAFVAENIDNNDFIAVVTLAASGVIFQQTNFLKILSAIKIDVLAVASKYQKIPYNIKTQAAQDPDEHMYLSDCILMEVLQHCNHISENYALVDYVILYADHSAYRFYQRNGFVKFASFMTQENNMEINQNIPMYIQLS